MQHTGQIRRLYNAGRSKEEIALDLTKLAYSVKNLQNHDQLLELFAKCLKAVKDVAQEGLDPQTARSNGNGTNENSGLVVVDQNKIPDAIEILKQSGINARVA